MDQILFVIIVTYALTIALNLIVLEAGDLSMEVAFAIFDLVSMSVLTFTYCLLSEILTTSLVEVSTNFYASPWYLLTAKQQYLLQFPIQRAQNEFRLKGLNIVDCSLAVFSSV